MHRCFVDFLKKHDVEYSELFDISCISSIGIGGAARVAVMPSNADELIKILDYLKGTGLEYKVVGAMSNILPPDGCYDGALLITRKMSRYSFEKNILTVDCGARLSAVLSSAARFNLGGMEELFGIPGTVGGMVFGNAGAYEKSVSDFFIDASIYYPSKNTVCTLNRNDMQFSYRRSAIKGTEAVLLSARFLLEDVPCETVRKRMKAIIRERKERQPYSEKSLGSVFLRCGDVPSSLIIDRLGLKGYRIGGAEISKKHAGFIINTGGATSADVKALVVFIKDKIFSSYGVIPNEEIEYLD